MQYQATRMFQELKFQLSTAILTILTVAAVVAAVINFDQQRKFRLPDDGVTWVDRKGGVEALYISYGSQATKAGLHAMTQSLAVHLAPHGIAVAAVAPGFVATEMAEELLAGPAGDGIRAQSPYGRVAEPDEIAAAVAWLASPLARWASGAVIDLNGASYLR